MAKNLLRDATRTVLPAGRSHRASNPAKASLRRPPNAEAWSRPRPGFPPAIAQALARRGHDVRFAAEPGPFGAGRSSGAIRRRACFAAARISALTESLLAGKASAYAESMIGTVVRRVCRSEHGRRGAADIAWIKSTLANEFFRFFDWTKSSIGLPPPERSSRSRRLSFYRKTAGNPAVRSASQDADTSTAPENCSIYCSSVTPCSMTSRAISLPT